MSVNPRLSSKVNNTSAGFPFPFPEFALPKILKRMGLKEDECIMTDEALDTVIELYSETTGIRDLEQAAEHIAANALYQIEVHHVSNVTFDGKMVRELLL